MTDSLAFLAEITHRVVGVPADQVRPESRLVEDLGAESLARVEILAAAEAQAGVRISDAAGILTIADLAAALEQAEP